ncbi:regulator of chromosome condensation domain-containing protein [Tieghemostelium lacteum]|uniref:Regulator of chromosome condensation domain-containing protein n=1 Tax=Tieghemostelium lacteum TaxID=361077 RepID=A0A151Z891_TIELA|nr:regulator of chromosome condensation domain-containing protein [Tieghemostelium lacteum]|eukprot:KYQ90170.1 regulator of chromosome condensation domain-containing protein [Tieghemostelium lacteum]
MISNLSKLTNRNCSTIEILHYQKRYLFNWFGKKKEDTNQQKQTTLGQFISSNKSDLTNVFKWSQNKDQVKTVVYSLGQNSQGQLGLEDLRSEKEYTFNESFIPHSIKSIKSNLIHSAAFTNSNDLLTWGSNMYFQIGHKNASTNSVFPSFVESSPHSVKVGSGFNKSQIIDYALGAWSCFVLVKSGDDLKYTDVYCWGNNRFGQLALSSQYNLQSPTKINRLSFRPALEPNENIIKVTSGLFHSHFLSNLGRVFSSGTLENANPLAIHVNTSQSDSTPLQVQSPTLATKLSKFKITDISAGCYHSIAIDQNNCIYQWGKGKLKKTTKDHLFMTPYSPENCFKDNIQTMDTDITMYTNITDKIIQIESGDDLSLILTKSGKLFQLKPSSKELIDITSSIPSQEKILKISLSITHGGVIFENSNQIYLWQLDDFTFEQSALKVHFSTLLPTNQPNKLFTHFPSDHIVKDLSLGPHFSHIVFEKKQT